jgi:hypothetical protein
MADKKKTKINDETEFRKYVVQSFTKVDQRFDKADKRFGGIEQRLDRLEENKADKEDVSKLLTAVDAYAHKADAYFQEMV